VVFIVVFWVVVILLLLLLIRVSVSAARLLLLQFLLFSHQHSFFPEFSIHNIHATVFADLRLGDSLGCNGLQ